MDTFHDKNIWIIGASRGIGRALSHQLSREGANLILSARDKQGLDSLQKDLRSESTVIPLDVGNEKAVFQSVSKIQKSHTSIDSVIFLAGLYDPGHIKDMDLVNMGKTMEVNLMSVFYLTKAILPVFEQQRDGQLALCGSVAGYTGLPVGQPYSATKAGVINFAESLKAEHPEFDIKVINPGFVRTDLTQKNDFEMPLMIEPEQAAVEISKGLLKSGFEIHFPKRFTFFMKLLRMLPYLAYFAIARELLKGKANKSK